METAPGTQAGRNRVRTPASPRQLDGRRRGGEPATASRSRPQIPATGRGDANARRQEQEADLAPTDAIEILLVEDNPGDVRLTQEGLKEGRIASNLHVVRDGREALDFLHREGAHERAPRPDLILLDLNLPKVDGHEVLAEIKGDPELRETPVVILTTSDAEEDVRESYRLHANSFVTKPVDYEAFMETIRSLGIYWVALVKLPREPTRDQRLG